ncbi:toll interleukin receptor [Trifolium medium]|uniref:Toll interleukin receptor n=1 Tax=Trifolium medium TaxID=97028 RepID=A0A392PAZ7_9FABA|nr:toll interleukin receptor [Trifolium medium]
MILVRYEYEIIQKIVESTVKSPPRYDVFLSFCGEDTRYSFTGFLYHALRREGFKIFMDDEGLEGGNQISQTLLKAIEKSRLSIVVLSENYGYSTWCLDELVKIMECKKNNNQLVWPIFYKIEQSDVSNQTKSYCKAMKAHEDRFGKESESVQKWRSALSEVALVKGDHYQRK